MARAERERELQRSDGEAKARSSSLDKQAAQLALQRQEVEQQEQRLQQREEVRQEGWCLLGATSWLCCFERITSGTCLHSQCC